MNSTEQEVHENMHIYIAKYISENEYMQWFCLCHDPAITTYPVLMEWSHPTKSQPTVTDLRAYTLAEAQQAFLDYTME